jgi:hypothetical protein
MVAGRGSLDCASKFETITNMQFLKAAAACFHEIYTKQFPRLFAAISAVNLTV